MLALRRGAVAVIVREGRFLVIRRSQTVVAPGAYCFPGGGIEPEESEQEALVRELNEELDLAVRPIRRVWQSVTSWHVALAWWLTEIPSGAVPRPKPEEVASFHWWTPGQMAAAEDLLASNREFLLAWQTGLIDLDIRSQEPGECS